jgi:hypothetical protein
MYPTNKFAHLRQVPYKIPARTSFPNIQSTRAMSPIIADPICTSALQCQNIKPTIDPDNNSNALSLALRECGIHSSAAVSI